MNRYEPDGVLLLLDVRGSLAKMAAAIGDEFENGDDIWLKYLATDDGTKACQSAYASANG